MPGVGRLAPPPSTERRSRVPLSCDGREEADAVEAGVEGGRFRERLLDDWVSGDVEVGAGRARRRRGEDGVEESGVGFDGVVRGLRRRRLK